MSVLLPSLVSARAAVRALDWLKLPAVVSRATPEAAFKVILLVLTSRLPVLKRVATLPSLKSLTPPTPRPMLPLAAAVTAPVALAAVFLKTSVPALTVVTPV